MAQGTIKTTVHKTGTVTASGSANVTNVIVRQYGEIVTVNGFALNVSMGNNVTVGTISGVPLPKETIRGLCGVAVNAYDHPADVAYFTIGLDGKIAVTSTVTGTRVVYFSVSYTV